LIRLPPLIDLQAPFGRVRLTPLSHPKRSRKAAKREDAAYYSSGRGKLNTYQGAGRMPYAVKRYGGGELPVAP